MPHHLPHGGGDRIPYGYKGRTYLPYNRRGSTPAFLPRIRRSSFQTMANDAWAPSSSFSFLPLPYYLSCGILRLLRLTLRIYRGHGLHTNAIRVLSIPISLRVAVTLWVVRGGPRTTLVHRSLYPRQGRHNLLQDRTTTTTLRGSFNGRKGRLRTTQSFKRVPLVLHHDTHPMTSHVTGVVRNGPQRSHVGVGSASPLSNLVIRRSVIWFHIIIHRTSQGLPTIGPPNGVTNHLLPLWRGDSLLLGLHNPPRGVLPSNFFGYHGPHPHIIRPQGYLVRYLYQVVHRGPLRTTRYSHTLVGLLQHFRLVGTTHPNSGPMQPPMIPIYIAMMQFIIRNQSSVWHLPLQITTPHGGLLFWRPHRAHGIFRRLFQV